MKKNNCLLEITIEDGETKRLEIESEGNGLYMAIGNILFIFNEECGFSREETKEVFNELIDDVYNFKSKLEEGEN